MAGNSKGRIGGLVLFGLLSWFVAGSGSNIQVSPFPPQAGNGGKFLGSDGSAVSWAYSAATGTYAGTPAAAAANTGRIWLPNDAPFLRLSTGAAYVDWGYLPRAGSVPAGIWTDVNMGGVSVEDSGGVQTLSFGNVGTSQHCRCASAPSTPYTVGMAFITGFWPGNDTRFGAGFRESSTGKLIVIAISRTFVANGKWTNATTFSADYNFDGFGANDNSPYNGSVVWNYLTNTGALLSWGIGKDSVHYNLVSGTKALNDFFTVGPDQYCFCTGSNQNAPANMPHKLSLVGLNID